MAKNATFETEADIRTDKNDSGENKSETRDQKKRETKKANRYLTEIKSLKEEQAQLKDQLMRKTAEFDNYKKRTEREYYDRIMNANERLISELLPVLDDMERAIDHARHGDDKKSLLEGTELIWKKLLGILEKQGLKYMPAQGEEFDPEKHDALLQLDKKGVESGKIVEEHLKGYTLNDKVIRHSQVIVAK
jgi:molecular chaperone GrpE